MADKGYQSVPYIFKDEKMQANFQNNFFKRPIARWRSFYLENFTSFPEVFNIFYFHGWNDFLRILEDIYIWVVPAFYSTLIASDEDNTLLKSLVRSFECQVLSSNIADITTNTPNDGILCRGGENVVEKTSRKNLVPPRKKLQKLS